MDEVHDLDAAASAFGTHVRRAAVTEDTVSRNVDALGVQYARQYETGRRQDLQLVDYWIGSLSGKTQAEFTRTNQQLRDMAELIMVSQGQGAAWPGSRGVPVVREGRLEPGSPVVAPADSQGIGQGTGGR